VLFSYFGGHVQFDRGGEGHMLSELGLIDVTFRDREFDFDVQPTPLLRRMCESRPELETLYSLLVEMVLASKYSPPFINQRQVERRLMMAGMTPDGVELLAEMIGEAVQVVR
jgi:hypothetical protein